MYRVRLLYADPALDGWSKEFGSAHAALSFYRRCYEAQETLQSRCVLSTDRLVGDSWETVFKDVVEVKEQP